MKAKRLKVRFVSAALSALLASNAGFVLSSPAFAENETIDNSELEEIFNDVENNEEEYFDYEYEENNEVNYSNDEYVEDYSSNEYVENVEEEIIDEENLEDNINEEDDIIEENYSNDEYVEDYSSNEYVENTEENIIIEENLEDNITEEENIIEENLEENNNEEDNIIEENLEDNINEESNIIEEDLEENNTEESNIIEEDLEESNNETQNDQELVENDIELDEELELKLAMAIKEDSNSELKNANESTELENESELENSVPAQAKVAIITTKVDDEGNPLIGATLQILDSEGNVLDEWISDGTQHVSMIPEGEYILREKSAPEGYIAAADKTFNVKIDEKEVNAGVDHDDSHDVCWHYAGVALYFVESEGLKEEVYCINQNWEEPNGTNYDGKVLDETNIRTFTPDADTSMSDADLYDKVLNIIYHRSMVEELFPDLSETEVRFITEYALKTYTSAEVTTRQAMRDENGKLIRDEEGNLIYEDIRFLRYYKYDPTSPKGYVIDKENGDGIGKLAEHWYNQHGKTPLPPEYASLFYYLVSDEDMHPEDMFLYIYSTKNLTEDGETYQNLLGVRWFDPYDEDYKTYLTVVNEKQELPPEEPEIPDKPSEPDKPDKPSNPDKPKEPEVPDKPSNPDKPKEPEIPDKPKEIEKIYVVECPKEPYRCSNGPKTGDESRTFEYALLMLASTMGMAGSINLLSTSLKKGKNKVKVR